MKIIKIHKEYIELQQLLKMVSIIQTGGEAKIFLKENIVLVNDLQENRRGRKLYPGDKIEVFGESYLIEVNES